MPKCAEKRRMIILERTVRQKTVRSNCNNQLFFLVSMTASSSASF